MEATVQSSNNLVMENVEVLYVELGTENQATEQSSGVNRRPVKTRSIVYQFFNWNVETNEWSCNICTYVKHSQCKFIRFQI